MLQPDLDTPAAWGELDGIRQEIPDDLLQTLRVARDGHARPIDGGLQLDALRGRGRRHCFQRILNYACEIDRPHVQAKLAGDDPRDIEDIADELFLELGISLDRLEDRGETLRANRSPSQHLRISQHRIERRAQLVGEGGQKFVLEPIRGLGLVLGHRERGHFVRDNDDRIHAPGVIEHGLVDKVEVGVLGLAARTAIQRHVHGLPDIGFAIETHAIEQLVNPLTGEFWQRLLDRLADELTASDQLEIAAVRQLVDVIRSTQDRDGHRGVFQETGHALRVPPLDGPGPRLEQLRVDPREQVPRGERFDQIVVS